MEFVQGLRPEHLQSFWYVANHCAISVGIWYELTISHFDIRNTRRRVQQQED